MADDEAAASRAVAARAAGGQKNAHHGASLTPRGVESRRVNYRHEPNSSPGGPHGEQAAHRPTRRRRGRRVSRFSKIGAYGRNDDGLAFLALASAEVGYFDGEDGEP